MGTPSAVCSSPVTPSYVRPAGGQPEPSRRAVAGSGLDPEPPHGLAETRSPPPSRPPRRNPRRVAREEQDLRSGVPLELRRERAVDPERRHDDAVLRAAGGVGHGDADRLVELVLIRRGLDPEALGGPALERPADQSAAGEIFVRQRSRCAVQALSTPSPSTISTQSAPVCARSSSAWSSRLARSSVRSASPMRDT